MTDLPALPDPAILGWDPTQGTWHGYKADQMVSFAREAVMAERERCAVLAVESMRGVRSPIAVPCGEKIAAAIRSLGE